MLRVIWIIGYCFLMLPMGCGGHGDMHDPADHDRHDRHDATMQHRFDDADQWSERFDSPERDAWQKPEVVIEALGIQTGQFVADIGAGTGYFTVRISRAVGREGRVIAVDVEPAMVEYIRSRANKAGLENIEPVLTQANKPGLAPTSVDLVFICDTWHHINDRLEYLKELRGVLRPGGRVAIVDYKPGELPVGPPKGHKLSPNAVIEEFTQTGWKFREKHDVLPYQYILVFEL